MAKRAFTSIGYERANNPRLQLDRAGLRRGQDPRNTTTFRRTSSACRRPTAARVPGLARLPQPQPMSVDEVDAATKAGAQLLDLRVDPAIGGACVREAVAIPLDMLASFGGWFLDAGRPIVLLLDAPGDRETAVRTLVRIGYDRIDGFLAGGFEGWATAGRPVASIPGLDVHALRHRLDGAGAAAPSRRARARRVRERTHRAVASPLCRRDRHPTGRLAGRSPGGHLLRLRPAGADRRRRAARLGRDGRLGLLGLDEGLEGRRLSAGQEPRRRAEAHERR